MYEIITHLLDVYATRTAESSKHVKMSGNNCLKTIDIESLQNRLLNVCYVPATSAGLPRVSFSFFVPAAINSTNEANKAGGTRC